MALKGNLRDFSTTQLLNLVNLARKTGTLALDRKKEKARMSFKAGKLIYASMGDHEGHLAQVLFKNGKLSREQSRAILARAGSTSDKELGLMLINAGYVTRQDILQSVRQHTLDVVYRLFTWNEGEFRFEASQLPPEGRITVPINLENVIMEGSRRLKEWEQLQDELPNLDMALQFTDRPGGVKLQNINLSVEEWRVISYINPRNSMRQIGQATKMSDFQIRRIIYGLLQAGLVELVRPEGVEVVPPPSRRERRAPTRTAARRPPPVKRSVVERLIGRIKGL